MTDLNNRLKERFLARENPERCIVEGVPSFSLFISLAVLGLKQFGLDAPSVWFVV